LIEEQILRRNVKRLRGGLVFKAHRLVYHSTLGWRERTKKKYTILLARVAACAIWTLMAAMDAAVPETAACLFGRVEG
jgi:hypothetical protein